MSTRCATSLLLSRSATTSATRKIGPLAPSMITCQSATSKPLVRTITTQGSHCRTNYLLPSTPTGPTLTYSCQTSRLGQRRWTNTNNRNILPKSDSPPTAKAPFVSFGIGTCAGIMGSLAGMGGGFVMIPLMTSRRLLGLSQHQAHGTSLFAVLFTGLAGALSYGDQVQYEAASAVALSAMLSARLGAMATNRISEKVLKRALGILMLTMTPAIPLKAYLLKQSKAPETASNPAKGLTKSNNTESSPPMTVESILPRLIAPAGIGMMSGFLAGVFGVGGGVVVVPALAVATDMTHYQALATSLAAMAPAAAVGTYTHYTLGNVVLRSGIAPMLAMGAFAGAYMGGKLSLQTNEAVLQWGFSGLLTVLGVRTLLKV